MGCASSTAVGYLLSEKEAAQLAVLEPHEEAFMEQHAMSLCADASPGAGGPPRLLLTRIMAISVGSALRKRQLLLVSERALYLESCPKRKADDPTAFVSALGISGVLCDGGNLVRIEVFHPEREMIQLQTDDPLRLITALRTWVSIAYLGTPPAFVGIRMRIPPELAPPLPPIKTSDGGFSRLLWPHLVLLLPPDDQDGRAVQRLQNALGVAPPQSLTAHPQGAESILKSPATLQLWDEATGPHIQTSPLVWGPTLRLHGIFVEETTPPDPLVSLPVFGAAFRALRFNTFFTALDLSCVDLTGYTPGQRYAWAVYLAEMLLHNTALQALTLPSQPLFLPLEAWATINRALCLSPRPRVHAWGLADAGMGDEGLAAMLPSWSRIFATQAGPSHLDLTRNKLTVRSLPLLADLLTGQQTFMHPPPPRPPNVAGLRILALSGNDLRAPAKPPRQRLSSLSSRLSSSPVPSMTINADMDGGSPRLSGRGSSSRGSGLFLPPRGSSSLLSPTAPPEGGETTVPLASSPLRKSDASLSSTPSFVGIEALQRLLAHATGLRELHLVKCNVDGEGLGAILQGIMAGGSPLEVLDVSDNPEALLRCDARTLRSFLAATRKTLRVFRANGAKLEATTLATLLGGHEQPLPDLRLELQGAVNGDRLPTQESLAAVQAAVRARNSPAAVEFADAALFPRLLLTLLQALAPSSPSTTLHPSTPPPPTPSSSAGVKAEVTQDVLTVVQSSGNSNGTTPSSAAASSPGPVVAGKGTAAAVAGPAAEEEQEGGPVASAAAASTPPSSQPAASGGEGEEPMAMASCPPPGPPVPSATAAELAMSITTLDLGGVWAQLKGEQASAMAAALTGLLAGSGTLQHLSLRGTRAEDWGQGLAKEAASFLGAAGLGANVGLLSLDITGMGVGDKGGRALAQALRRNRALQRLRLDDNGLSYESFSALRKALGRNSRLLDLPDPKTDADKLRADIERRAVLAMGSVAHAKKALAGAETEEAKATFFVEIKASTKQLKALEREQDRLRDSLREISMSVAANAMAHEQRQAERRRARGLVGGRREAACAKYSATATELLQALARAVGSVKARRGRVGMNGQGAAAGASSHSSPTRPSASQAMHLPRQQQQPPQPQQCFRAGGGGGYIHNPDVWRFDPFIAPLPLTVPLPSAVLDAAALAATDPLLAADQQNGADFDEHVKQVGSSLPLPAEYLPGPPPPPAMLPQRGDAIRGVALDVLNPFDAAARAVHALGGGDDGTGEMWSIPRQESQMKDAVLPPGMLADAAMAAAAAGGGGGGGEEGAVLGRLEGLLGLGPQLLQTPTLLAEARALSNQLGADASAALRPPLSALEDLGRELAAAADRLGGGVQPLDLLVGVKEEMGPCTTAAIDTQGNGNGPTHAEAVEDAAAAVAMAEGLGGAAGRFGVGRLRNGGVFDSNGGESESIQMLGIERGDVEEEEEEEEMMEGSEPEEADELVGDEGFLDADDEEEDEDDEEEDGA